MLALGRRVEVVEERALLGEAHQRAAAIGEELDRRQRDRDQPVVVQQVVREHDALVFDDVVEAAAELVVTAMTSDVDWPNGWEGGRIAGREAVREYWLRQWQAIDGRVEPVAITLGEDGRWTVVVHQVVRTPEGALLADEHVHHVYAFRDDLVHRMDIESAPQP